MRVVQTPTGRLHLLLTNPESGEVVADHWEQNLVTTVGRSLLAELLTGITAGIAKVELAVGGSRDPAEPGDLPTPEPYPDADAEGSALHAELLRVPTEFGAINVVPSVDPQNPATRSATAISAVLPADLGGPVVTLREAGLVMTRLVVGGGGGDPMEDEVLYNHVVFGGPITKNPELQMTLTWEVIF